MSPTTNAVVFTGDDPRDEMTLLEMAQTLSPEQRRWLSRRFLA